MPAPPGERILIPGASGFFGAWIVRFLKRDGHDVVARSRSDLDLTDAAQVMREVAETEPTVVVNPAGISSPAVARRDPAACFRVNTGGMLNLLEAIRRAAPDAHLVNLSSAAVYAPPTSDRPIDESHPVAAVNPYGASKLAAELICSQYRREGLGITTLRLFNLIGPGQPSEQAAGEFTRAVAGALSRADSGVVIRVGNPETSRDFTDVRDAARAIVAVIARRSTGTFNLCSGRTVSLAALAATLETAARERTPGFTVELAGDPDRVVTGDPGRLVGNPEEFERATNWQATTSLDRSVEAALEAALFQQGERR